MRAFVIFRDRVTYATRCVDALHAAGLDVVIVDHGTTYPDALDWLAELESQGLRVVREGPGNHPRDLWSKAWFREMCGQDRYIVTDPDVIPSADCPADWAEQLGRVLDANPGIPKAGIALSLDVPLHYKRRHNVLNWENRFWVTPAHGDAYSAPVDTTLALHAPLHVQDRFTYVAVRTASPYVADHLPWSEDDDHLPDDVAWYYQHAEPGISCWAPRA